MVKCLCHLITTKCEVDDAEGGHLPPDISFDDNVIGDKHVREDEDDEEAARNDGAGSSTPIEVAPVACGNGILAPLPQNISGITESRKRAALKSKSNDILEIYALKILQKDEEREAEHECYERGGEERASKM